MKLPAASLDWLRQSLLDGPMLGQELLRIHDPTLGLAYAAVPRGFPSSGLEHPEWGQGMVNKRQSEEALRELIGTATPRLVVVQDPMMHPADPIFERHSDESFFFGTEVYHWSLCRSADDYRSIGPFLSRWTSYPFNAMLIRTSRTYRKGEEVSRGEITRLAELTETVVVGAYDNEGYIVWQPAARPLDG